MFQSTHPHRVRQLLWLRELSQFCFNPRTHIGCDQKRWKQPSIPFCFNPRTHIGCDVLTLSLIAFNSVFQSTHPHRVRRIKYRRIAFEECFNPRTHIGCDLHWEDKPKAFPMFQSTHPRRVRLDDNRMAEHGAVFQSTHPRRVRREGLHPRRVPTGVSIHAPT